MSDGTTVTHRDDGTKVTITIEGNVRTTVYEKDGHIRREKFVMASVEEAPARRNPWGPQPVSHSSRLVPSSSSSDGYTKRVITIPASGSSMDSGDFESSASSSNPPARKSAFNTIGVDEANVPSRRAGSNSYSVPTGYVPNRSSSPGPGSGPGPNHATTGGSSFNAYSFNSPPPQSQSQSNYGQTAHNPSAPNTPQLVSSGTFHPQPSELVPPFEAIGVADFDVAPVERGAEYLIIEVNDAGSRFAVRTADGRIGWFPSKMVDILPSSNPVPAPLRLPTSPSPFSSQQSSMSPISMEPINFSLAPNGNTNGMNFGFLTPAPVAEAHYTTINSNQPIKTVSIEDIAALVDIDATVPQNPKKRQPGNNSNINITNNSSNNNKQAQAQAQYQQQQQNNSFKTMRPLGHGHQLTTNPNANPNHTSEPSMNEGFGRYDRELLEIEAELSPGAFDMTATVPPPSLPPAPPPPDAFDPFAEVTFYEFETPKQSAPQKPSPTMAPKPIFAPNPKPASPAPNPKPSSPAPVPKSSSPVPPAKPPANAAIRQPLPTKNSSPALQYQPKPVKAAELMSFDEIDASLAAISQQYELPAVDTSGNAKPVTFDEIDASLALIAQELEEPIGAKKKRITYSDAGFGDTSIIDLDGGLIMDDVELDSMIMEEELAKGFSELQSLAKEAEMERTAIEERERTASRHQPQSHHHWGKGSNQGQGNRAKPPPGPPPGKR